ncbi:MAG: mannose-6-phosphate isomerase, class I [Patescibacteria group bacterium]
MNYHLDYFTKHRIFPILGKIFSSPYDWGGIRLIPPTLGFTPEPGVPYAEYWLGVHKKAPAQVILPDGTTQPLDQIIQKNPGNVLNNHVAKKFGNLPFLFKLLDAGEMLSIQVHPNKQQAEEGFMQEEEKGISITDSKRTYKDKNHKVEFAVAMDEFWLLHGFRQKEDLRTILTEVEELQPLLSSFDGEDYRNLYKHIMIDMNEEQANTILHTLAQRILPQYEAGQLTKSQPDYWAAKAMKYMQMSDGNYDRGIFSIYLLNLVRLETGQAIFQDAGVLHAYLEGPIIEIMTTSDNVARGGITGKYVDVDELMKLVTFTGVKPHIITGRKIENETFYNSPCKEFLLSKIEPKENSSYKKTSQSAEIFMGMEGDANIRSDDNQLSVGKGKSTIIFAETTYEITGAEGDIVFRASIPDA